MIYLFDQMERFTESSLRHCRMRLSVQRQKKIDALRFIDAKKQSALAYLLLLYGLQQEYGICDAPVFVFMNHGKPVLQDYPDIYFSLSHCSTGILCALHHSPIGADIQEPPAHYQTVMRRALTPNEQQLTESSCNPAETFTAFWTMKESYIKYRGTGLSEDLRALDFSESLHSRNFKDCRLQTTRSLRYCYTVCSPSLPSEPIHSLSLDAIM